MVLEVLPVIDWPSSLGQVAADDNGGIYSMARTQKERERRRDPDSLVPLRATPVTEGDTSRNIVFRHLPVVTHCGVWTCGRLLKSKL